MQGKLVYKTSMRDFEIGVERLSFFPLDLEDVKERKNGDDGVPLRALISPVLIFSC